MQPFRGDLLMGGVRLRELTGSLLDIPVGHDPMWCGHFLVDTAKRNLFEFDRPYLLMLQDGRCGRVVVTELWETDHDNALRVEFQPG